MGNLIIETAGIEEEVMEQLEAALEMEVEEEGEVEGDGREGGYGNLRALVAQKFLTQDAEPSGTTLIDACNEFNNLSRLEMLWTVQNRWPAGARFAFNCYMHWSQLLLRQMGDPPVTILSREGATQGNPFSMVMYGITLAPLAEELRAADLGLLSPFYADDTAFDGSARKSAPLLKLLMKRGLDQGYYTKPAKFLFITDTPGKEEAVEGIDLNFVSGSRYLGAYLGLQEELKAWVKPQVEVLAYRVRVLGKLARRHPQ